MSLLICSENSICQGTGRLHSLASTYSVIFKSFITHFPLTLKEITTKEHRMGLPLLESSLQRQKDRGLAGECENGSASKQYPKNLGIQGKEHIYLTFFFSV